MRRTIAGCARGAGAVRAAGAVVVVGLAACGPAAGVREPVAGATGSVGASGGGDAEPGWSVRESAGKPRAVSVERSGDGQAAVAVGVAQAGGLVAHTALAALVEARLRAAGLAAAGAGDRDGFRVTVAAGDAAGVERATRLLIEAVQRPVGAEEAGPVKLAAARVALLKTQALGGAALEALAACTGEPAPAAGTEVPALAGAAQVEAWRRGVVAARTAFGFVGPGEVIGPGAVAVEGSSGWTEGKPAEEARPGRGSTAVLAEPGRRRGSGQVSVAVWFDDPAAGPAAAARLGRDGSGVAGRLGGLRGEFGLRRAVGVVRPGGSCVVASAEGTIGDSSEEAAAAAMVLRQEVLRGASGGREEPAAVVRRMSDPREAAGAAAWWSLARRGEGGTQTRVVLEVASEPGDGGARGGGQGAEARFGAAWQALERAPAAAVETRVAAEPGQGVLRVLLASACPVAEAAGEHGVTALALRSLPRRAGSEVRVTPWLAADGAGVMAEGPRRPGERVEDWGARVAGEAAEALLGAPPEASVVQQERGVMLGQLGSEWPAAVWSALAPEQPGRLWPAGSPDGVARASAETVRLRWGRLGAGPVRLAVLATGGAGQAQAATEAVQRWLAPSPRPRACPAVGAPGAGASGSLPAGVERAFVGWRVDASGASVGAAAATALLLGGPGGALGGALEGTGVSAQTVVVGQGAESALVIELRGSRDGLEGAIDRSKGVVERLEALTEGPEGKQALSRWGELEREARLDPAQRLAAVWRGATRPAIPTAADWKRWVGAQVRPAGAVVLRPGR